MNIIKSLISRIENRLQETKAPCKGYATEEAAEKAAEKASIELGKYWDLNNQPMRYVVFYVPSWGKWTAALDLTEMAGRKMFAGGYLGNNKGFYTY